MRSGARFSYQPALAHGRTRWMARVLSTAATFMGHECGFATIQEGRVNSVLRRWRAALPAYVCSVICLTFVNVRLA